MTSSSDTLTANPTRELAAIMFSDIIGYTAIMGRDEREGLRAVREHREHLRVLLPQFNGRLIGEIGDGTLSSFHSAVDAVNCARELQATLVADPELRLRIGIHVGDVVFTDKTVLGDGVNIASRIHELAPPGGCCISERVYEEIRNKPEFHVQDLGEKHLKNVARPIRAYVLTATAAPGQLRSPFRSSTDADQSRRRGIVIAVGAVLFVATIGISTWKWMGLGSGWLPTGVRTAATRSIAVLPLENLSGDPAQEYFADGMTDELITALAQISGLRVISRTSVMKFKGEHREQISQIAKTLGVNTIVEGSVLQVGDKVRITAQLIDAPSDRHLWADSYERETRDVLTLQDEVASSIAQKIDVELTPNEQARFASARPVNPQAQEAYLKGRFFMTSFSRDRGRKAQEQFERAIKLDPRFALAYTGLADLYAYAADNVLQPAAVVPKQRAAAEEALRLDDSLAEAHVSLAMVKFWNDYDWEGAEREFRRAIELNPSYALARDQYGWLLMYEGRSDESLAEMRRASELDPLSAVITNNVAFPLMYQAKYQAAQEQTRKALELDPDFAFPEFALGWIDIEAGKFKEATSALEKARKMDSLPYYAAWLGYAFAAAGEQQKAQGIIVELEQASSKRWVSPFATAIVYLGQGEKREALDGLEKAYEARSQWLTLLKVDKMFDPLRSEPRFKALLVKVGLDE